MAQSAQPRALQVDSQERDGTRFSRGRLRHLRDNWQDAVRIIAALVGLIWCIGVLNHLSGFLLNQFGILPRTFSGLPGVFTWVLLHGSYLHMLLNTMPLLFLGFFVGLRGPVLFFKITAIIWWGAGLAVWLLGRDAVHIGSSGLVFGYFGFLLAVAISERNVFDLGVASVVLFYYGGMFAGILPADALVSWEAHLAGFITGGLAARWLGPEWAAR